MKLNIKQGENDLFFPVKALPGSSNTKIAGLWDSLLKVNIASAPHKGKANKELIRFLAQLLNIPKSDVNIVSGLHDPRKLVRVIGLNQTQLLEKLKPYL